MRNQGGGLGSDACLIKDHIQARTLISQTSLSVMLPPPGALPHAERQSGFPKSLTLTDFFVFSYLVQICYGFLFVETAAIKISTSARIELMPFAGLGFPKMGTVTVPFALPLAFTVCN